MSSNVKVGTASNANIAGGDIHIHHNVSNQSRLSQNFDELGKKLGWVIHIQNKVDLSESSTYCAMRRDSTSPGSNHENATYEYTAKATP